MQCRYTHWNQISIRCNLRKVERKEDGWVGGGAMFQCQQCDILNQLKPNKYKMQPKRMKIGNLYKKNMTLLNYMNLHPYSCRLVQTQEEVERQVMREDGSIEPIVTIEEEEEVVLFWNSGNLSDKKFKAIRELAQGAKENVKDDVDVLKYYRYDVQSILPFYNSVRHLWLTQERPKFALHHGKMSTNTCHEIQNYTWACFKWPKNVDKTISNWNTQ